MIDQFAQQISDSLVSKKPMSDEQLTQAVITVKDQPITTTLSVVSSEGKYFVTVEPAALIDFSPDVLQLVMWLDSLQEDDHVILSLLTTSGLRRLDCYTTALGGLYRCKAKIEVKVDHFDPCETSYFYLVADIQRWYSPGALYFPALTRDRGEDLSTSDKVMISFLNKIAQEAVTKGFLTQEQADLVKSNKNFGISYKDITAKDPELLKTSFVVVP